MHVVAHERGTPALPRQVTLTPRSTTPSSAEAIRADRFWVLTHPEYDPAIEQRQRGMQETGDTVAPAIL